MKLLWRTFLQRHSRCLHDRRHEIGQCNDFMAISLAHHHAIATVLPAANESDNLHPRVLAFGVSKKTTSKNLIVCKKDSPIMRPAYSTSPYRRVICQTIAIVFIVLMAEAAAKNPADKKLTTCKSNNYQGNCANLFRGWPDQPDTTGKGVPPRDSAGTSCSLM